MTSASKAKLNCLDLFSGIGGFAHGLASAVRTVAYCEIDPLCRRVLTKNMQRGQLDRAPIFEDITKLQASEVSRVCRRVDVVCGGFPCQDVSVSGPRSIGGKHDGVRGSRTGLFAHIVRLVRELPSVRYIFLENVANILNQGLEDVLDAIRELGFSYAYGVFQANEIGASHKRRRLFIFACRNSALAERRAPKCDTITFKAWSREPAVRSRLVKRTATSRVPNVERFMMLGNSVVPQCAAHAWNELSVRLMSPSVCLPGNDDTKGDRIVGKVVVARQTGRPIECYRDVRLKLRPIRMPDGAERMNWATPQRSYIYPYFTESSHERIRADATTSVRGFSNLINQLYFEADTIKSFASVPPHDLGKHFDANPRFLEWLMGFPRDWTRV